MPLGGRWERFLRHGEYIYSGVAAEAIVRRFQGSALLPHFLENIISIFQRLVTFEYGELRCLQKELGCECPPILRGHRSWIENITSKRQAFKENEVKVTLAIDFDYYNNVLKEQPST